MLDGFLSTIGELWSQSGFANMTWQSGLMILISFVFMFLAIKKGFEPLLLLPIAFGMLLTNLPGAEMFHLDLFIQEEINYGAVLHEGGFLDSCTWAGCSS